MPIGNCKQTGDTMGEGEGLQELRRLNVELKNLLDDPEPGLRSWRQELATTIKEINLFRGEGF